jgi:hypothetical protein
VRPGKCWRCGQTVELFNARGQVTSTRRHADWCSDGTPGDCDHCGGNPCRWWCYIGHVYAWSPYPNGYAVIVEDAA